MLARSRHIRAIVFDLDDTLFLERNYVRSGFAAVGEYLRDQTRRRAMFERWMWRRFISGRRDGMFDALGKHFGLGLTSSEILRLVDVYRRHRPDIRPCRGVEAVLSRLRRRRLKLGLLSDGFLPAQRLKLEAIGLEKYFHKVIFTEQMGRDAWKPSPRGFESIRRALSAPHAGCVYVADNPAKDFLAPNGLGWLTIQWRRVGQVHADKPTPQGGKPQRVIRSGPELLRLVEHFT
ncbi:MAG: HAD family hydrolase [Planctomycetota bacterium]|nr:HAD family hydrolase [Planctomycetota bacterium]